MAVDQRGVHLLEFRTRNVLNSFEYDSILDYTPSLNHMLLITGTDKKQSKIIVNTNQVREKFILKENMGFFSTIFFRPSKFPIWSANTSRFCVLALGRPVTGTCGKWRNWWRLQPAALMAAVATTELPTNRNPSMLLDDITPIRHHKRLWRFSN